MGSGNGGGRKICPFARGDSTSPHKIEPIPQPEPRPPRETRPTRLSVTAIEDWLRDPYTIYATAHSQARPLDPVDMPLSAADRGSAIHARSANSRKSMPMACRATRDVTAQHRPASFLSR